MFEQFTAQTRNILLLAQEEARSVGKLYVGTEHILLAYLKDEENAVTQVLSSFDITYAQAYEIVESLASTGTADAASGHVPFSALTKHALAQAFTLASAHATGLITTKDLFIAMLALPESHACLVLTRIGVSFSSLSTAIDALDDSEEYTTPEGAESTQDEQDDDLTEVAYGIPSASQARSKMGKLLKRYGKNLVAVAQQEKLDPVIGRDKEITRIAQILARRQKNNPLILGDPGVGKTAVVEGLAQLIATHNAPVTLADKQIWTLDVSSMLAGAKYRGEFEDRLKRVINEVRKAKNIILFIDEIHTIIGAGSAEGSIDAASILKPPLSRSEIQVIGATTAEEYRKHIEKDPALERRFQPVEVCEPTVSQTLQILKGLSARYEAFHHVHYTQNALVEATRLSHRYIQDRFLPDKAIDVIDEAGARKSVVKRHEPHEIVAMRTALTKLKEKKERLLARENYEDAASVRDDEKSLEQKIAHAVKDWEKSRASEQQNVDVNDIARVISDISGVPVTSLTEKESEKLLRCEQELHKRLIGQKEAVAKVAHAIRRSRSPLKDPARPGGSFIFLGPSGVGKTELAKSLAEFLFGTQEALISFDMSEFMEKHEVSKLVGAPPGYVGYDQGGELTKAVRRRPYSVVLFDEIEKAHPDVFNILLQILEEGRLTDGQGRVVDFSNTVIIMTSNIGAREIAHTSPMGFSSQGDDGLSYKEIKSRVKGELKRSFRPEFLNRVDEIVVFTTLSKEELRKIVGLMVSKLAYRLAQEHIMLTLSDAACDLIAQKGTDPIYGARPLRRTLQRLVEDRLAEDLLEHKWNAGDEVYVDAQEHELVFKKREADLQKLQALRAQGSQLADAAPHVSHERSVSYAGTQNASGGAYSE